MSLPFSTIFDSFVKSYYFTPRQKAIGEYRQVGPMPCIHYDYVWAGEYHLADNIFVWGQEPVEVVLAVRAYGPTANHQLLVIEDRPDLQEYYLSLGCWLRSVEYLMSRPLTASFPSSSLEIREVLTPADVEQINVTGELGELLPTDINNEQVQNYYVWLDETAVARARSDFHSPTISWVSNVHTLPNYRRRGLATALLQHVLTINYQAGSQYNLLLSTHIGHSLYQRIGYMDVVPVLNFSLIPV